MANFHDWELSPYQFAAEKMCQRVGESPHELVQDAAGMQVPMWIGYAARMHELRLMAQLMRDAGIPL